MEYLTTSFDLSVYLLIAFIIACAIRVEAVRQYHKNWETTGDRRFPDVITKVFGERVRIYGARDNTGDPQLGDVFSYWALQICGPFLWPVAIPLGLVVVILKALLDSVLKVSSKVTGFLDGLGKSAAINKETKETK